MVGRGADARKRVAGLRAQALKLYVARATYDQIGQAMGVSERYARSLVEGALKEAAKQEVRDIRILRLREMAITDAVIRAMWPNIHKPHNARTIIQALDRRSKYLGLDAPTQQVVKFDNLPFDEAARRLAALLAAVDKRRALEAGDRTVEAQAPVPALPPQGHLDEAAAAALPMDATPPAEETAPALAEGEDAA
jgi:hypothetical protein